MKLTTKGRYAVMAMVDMAMQNAQDPVSMPDISARQNISLHYLEQIFIKLRKADLLESVRGAKGGYKLTKDPSQIYVSEIIMAVSEALQITRCNNDSGKKGCMPGHAKCLTHDLWEGLGQHIYSFLRSVTLQDICHRNIPLNPQYYEQQKFAHFIDINIKERVKI